MTPLLERELIVVVGKGGVGRSTAAAALGLAACGSSRSVIVCETGAQGSVPAILGRRPPEPGEIVGLGDGLAATAIDPDSALRDWMSAQVGSALSRVLGSSRSFGQFFGAAPGARELVTITKAWELGPGRSWKRGGPTHETVVLDAPATGHGVAMLRAPRTFADLTAAGPIRNQAEKVWDLLSDPARSALVAVTLPSELPVGETLDLAAWVQETLGRDLDAVLVNRCESNGFSGPDLKAIKGAAGTVLPAEAASVAVAASRRAEGQAELIADIEESFKGRVVVLPEFPAGTEERAIAEGIASTLERELD
ncbi:MAG: ArsA-related P-loop ATPase [Actinomycetes bacterium]